MNSLHHYIARIINFHSQPQQLTVYEHLLKDSLTLRFHYYFYKLLQFFNIGYFSLAFYGFRTAGRFDVFTALKGESVAIVNVPSHFRAIEFVCDFSENTINPTYLKEDESRIKRLQNILRFARELAKKEHGRFLRKTLRIVCNIESKHGWVQALNVASFIFSVFAFDGIFDKENKIAISANDFSPVPLAFKYAAHNAGLKQIFVMHGQISAAESGNFFAPLDYDVSLLYGDAALQAYESWGQTTGRVVLIGFPGDSKPIKQVPEKIQYIGVCLANYYDDDTHALIGRISELYNGARFFVRCHPRQTDKPDYSAHGNIKLSRHPSMEQFADACDFVIAGNTGAQIDLLKLGCPIVHCSALDKLGHDDIGLVADNTVMLFEEDKKPTASELNQFFGSDWLQKFRKYDAMYLVGDEELAQKRQEIKDAYTSLLTSS